MPAASPRLAPRVVGLCLACALAVACGARPAPPHGPNDEERSTPKADGPTGDPSASARTSADVVPSGSAASSAAAAPGAAPPSTPLVARPAKVAFVVDLVEHSDPYALAPAPDGGVFVLGETAWGYSYKDDLLFARLAPDGSDVFLTMGTGRNVRQIAVSREAVFLSTELVGQVRLSGLTIPTVGGSTDLFIGKSDFDGKLAWGKMIGTPSYDRAGLLAPTADGGVMVAHGAFSSRKDGPIVFTPAGGEDSLLSRFDADGTKRWTRFFGLPGYDEPNAIVVAPSGDVFLAGTRWRSRDEWASALDSNVCEGYLLRLSPEGEVRWNLGLGGYRGHTVMRALHLAPNGDLLLRGRTRGTVTLGETSFDGKDERGLFVRVTAEGAIAKARVAPLTDCHVVHPSGTTLAVSSKGVFHEDEDGKRTEIVAFEDPDLRPHDCVLGGPGRLYVSGRARVRTSIGGVPVGAPRHLRAKANVGTYANGFVAGIDL